MFAAGVGFVVAAGIVYKYATRTRSTLSSESPPSVQGVVIDDTRVKSILNIADGPDLYVVWDVDTMTAQELDLLASRLAYVRTACSNDKTQPSSDAHPAIKFAAFAGGSKEAFVAAVSVYYHEDVSVVGVDGLYEKNLALIESLV
jgi:hypothetical protein